MDNFCSSTLPRLPADVFVNGTVYCWNYELNQSYWQNERDFTCKIFDTGSCFCPELKADPDIAGIGVGTYFSNLRIHHGNDAEE